MHKKICFFICALVIFVCCGCAEKTETSPTEQTICGETTEETYPGIVEFSFDENAEVTFCDALTPSETTSSTEATTTEDETAEEETTGAAIVPDTSLTYEEFQAMTPTQQRKFQESFSDISLFFDWYEAAKETYEKEHPPIIFDGIVPPLD